MCRFTDRNAEIKSQLITGCLSEKVRQKGLMNPNMLLGDLINYAKMTETISKQMEQMRLEDTNSTTKPTTSVNAVANRVTHEQQWPRKRPQQIRCWNCNGKYPHERGPTSCPAFQNQCAYCQRWGHFASVCFRKLNDEDRRRRTNRPPRPQAQTSQRPVNYIKDHQRDSNSGSDTEYVFHTGKVKNLPYFDLSFGDGHQMFNVLADSGATINILSEADYKSPRPTPLLRPTKTVISGFGVKEATPLLGQFSTLLKFRGISCQADIHVIKNPEKPIIGWETCKRLKLLSANTHSVNHISNSDAQTPLPTLKLLEDYADLFHGLGKLKEKKVHLHIDENIPPIAQRYRRVPFHVRKDIEELIAKDEKLGVIEKADGPTPWVSPIVVVPKKGQNKIRICIDMRAANKAIKRKRHPTPTLNELKTILSGANVFSKLDLNQGYNQLELAEKSRYITTFATHLSLYRYKRLFFGVNSASEIFQEEISQALTGIKGAINISDDILCFGSDQQDHDQNLHAIFRRLREKGLTLNGSKCEYNKRSLEFLGHTFGNEGISPSDLKIKAILGLPDPKNASEVRSLLGMTNFCGAEFIPNYATLTHELRQLTKKKKNTQWSWTERHTECLKNIKEALSRACSLAYFDPNKHTEIHTDASPVGISAVLSQNGRIVQFASRALSAVEQRYSQTEREALAITWACEHFHIYIFSIHCLYRPQTPNIHF